MGKELPRYCHSNGYMEVKSSGRSKRIIVGRDQMVRYADADTTYAIFVHDLHLTKDMLPMSLQSLRELLAQHIQEVLLIHARDLLKIVGDRWVQMCYYQSNNRGPAVMTAFPLPIKDICVREAQNHIPFCTSAYSLDTKPFPVRTYWL